MSANPTYDLDGSRIISGRHADDHTRRPPAGPSRFQNSFQDRGAAKLKDAEDADWNALVQSPLHPQYLELTTHSRQRRASAALQVFTYSANAAAEAAQEVVAEAAAP